MTIDLNGGELEVLIVALQRYILDTKTVSNYCNIANKAHFDSQLRYAEIIKGKLQNALNTRP